MRKPVIAMPASTMIVEDHVFTGMYRPFVNQDYIDCIEAAGGIPVIVPVMNEEDSYELIKFADGVLLPGGHDIAPNLYGEDPIPEQGLSYESVDRLYIHMVRQACESKKPVLGICKGHQLINIAFGGTLYQDLPSQNKGVYKHWQEAPRNHPTHVIKADEDSFIGRCVGGELMVNSYHHQAIKDLADGFVVTAWARDGVIEGIEMIGEQFIAGIQWHPEMMACFGDPSMSRIFQTFVEKCKRNQWFRLDNKVNKKKGRPEIQISGLF